MDSSSKPSSDGDPSLPDSIVLDACVLLNLFATGRVDDILGSLPSRCLVSPYVRRETLWYLAPSSEGSDKMERCDISLQPVVAAGLLEVVDLTPEEQSAFVELARYLGDGEAASGAIASGRSAAVATDDARARQVFEHRTPPLAVVGTSTLLRFWEVRSGTSRADVAATLRAIQLGARYYPRGDGEDAVWWQERMTEISLH